MSLLKIFFINTCHSLVLLLPVNDLYGQMEPSRPVMNDTMHFQTYQKLMNAFFENNPTAKGYKQWKRKEWFLAPRLYPSGERENLTLKTWNAYDRYIKSQPSQRATHGSWTFLGPLFHPVGLGRINAIAFHPTNENIMYIGSSNGGVWKTTNGGANWTNVSPDIPLLAIADVELSPTNSNVVYVLTGDGDPLPIETTIHSQTEVSSIGILRSADGGATWHPTNFSFGVPSLLTPTQLRIHPTNPNIQYVANAFGIHRTTDHWANWTLELGGTVIYDIEFKPDDPNVMYAASDNQIFRSTDGGDNWTLSTDADLNLQVDARIELAVAPNNSNIVYALSGSWSGFLDFYKSTNQALNNTWTLQNTTTNVMGGFTNYCVALEVDPADWTDVFGGMQWICKSTNEGVNWTSIVDDFVHADIHDVAYKNGALWVCCDGGLYKSTDEGSSWTNLTTGLAITEVYRVAGTAMNTDLYFLGAQDNGTMRRNGATTSFGEAYGGDGMTPMIDHSNDDIIYASSQNGVFGKSITGGGNGSFTTLSIPGGSGAWITPAIMDPIDAEILFVGKTSVFRSDEGGATGSWQDLGSPSGSLLNCLAQGTSNTNRLYASSGSQIYRTDNAKVASGTATWTNIGGGVPNLAISGIAVDPENSLRVFVTLSGYIDGSKVFRSVNGGSTWTNISGSLPNVPANCIVFHGNGSGLDEIYIGTDVGVFYRNNTLGDWIYYSNFMPAVNVSDLYINTGNNTIVAGTYGRGLWRSSLYTGCAANVSLTNTGILIGGVRFYSATNSITSTVPYKKDEGTSIIYQAGNFIDLKTDFNAGGLGFFEAKTGPCPEIYYEPMMSPYSPSGKFSMEIISEEKEAVQKE